jgi:hypothetical protein
LALHFLQIVTTTDDIKGLILSHPSFQVKHALGQQKANCNVWSGYYLSLSLIVFLDTVRYPNIR